MDNRSKLSPPTIIRTDDENLSQNPYGEGFENIDVYDFHEDSDEEIQIFKSKPRRKIDTDWKPKCGLGQLLPRTNHPARERTQKQSVQTVLKVAAGARRIATTIAEMEKKRSTPPKRQYICKKRKQKKESQTDSNHLAEPLPLPTTAIQTEGRDPIASSSSDMVNNNVGSTLPLRKGMKTAKQRLGKILKINKMTI